MPPEHATRDPRKSLEGLVSLLIVGANNDQPLPDLDWWVIALGERKVTPQEVWDAVISIGSTAKRFPTFEEFDAVIRFNRMTGGAIHDGR